jgi:hypothetical protein
MKKFLLVIFLISVLTSGLFAVESNIDTSGLEEISWEEVGDNAVIYEVGDGYYIIEFEGKYYIFFE